MPMQCHWKWTRKIPNWTWKCKTPQKTSKKKRKGTNLAERRERTWRGERRREESAWWRNFQREGWLFPKQRWETNTSPNSGLGSRTAHLATSIADTRGLSFLSWHHFNVCKTRPWNSLPSISIYMWERVKSLWVFAANSPTKSERRCKRKRSHCLLLSSERLWCSERQSLSQWPECGLWALDINPSSNGTAWAVKGR